MIYTDLQKNPKGRYLMTIDEKISTLRRDAGMSQDELAEKLDVSRQSVSKWESGKAIPDSAKILALSQLFNVSTDFLLKDDQEFIYEEQAEPEKTAETVEEAETENAKDGNNKMKKLAAGAAIAAGTAGAAYSVHKKRKKKRAKKIIAVVAALCILAAGIIIPYKTGACDKLLAKISEKSIDYPYILVHGLGGWGPESKINKTVPYWGNSAGNLAAYMTGNGSETYEASVGPFSSTWDRTCELYAQLTGTTVDYGEAHSKAHDHERFGREYTKPLFEGWGEKTEAGQIKKINLVGHSFGGETVRLLASLLEYGNEAEKQTSGEVSPLFEGGKGEWVNSVTTLCSPHNGSTLFFAVNRMKLVETILGVVYAASGVSRETPLKDFYDFRLEQFGVTDISNPKTVLNNVFGKGTDNAAYDLSPDGAEELNKTIRTVSGVYYFSYSYSTTEKSAITGKYIPKLTTLPILIPTAAIMGRYSENTTSDFIIDETWLDNDGLVNVVSARYPTGEEWQAFDKDNIVSGKWNVMPTESGDHGTVIGLYADADKTRAFYDNLVQMINGIPRDKKFYISL